MKNRIELSKSNYKKYTPINAMAFSYANGGAQGEPGGIIILDNNGTFFHFNYNEGDLKKDEIFEICPSLKEVALNQIPENFEKMNMGMGNTLFVNKSIFPEVKEKTKDLKNPAALYIQWKHIILDIIKNK